MGWEITISLAFNKAISVRVSNELGAGHPRATKFAVIIVLGTMFIIGAILMTVIFITANEFAVAFTNSEKVMTVISNLVTVLAISMLLNSIQVVLGGVAVGAGWKPLVAYINLACYYILGVPLGCLLGYYLDFGVKGIWAGMICGTTLQTIILSIITFRTKWRKEPRVRNYSMNRDLITLAEVWQHSEEDWTLRQEKVKIVTNRVPIVRVI
ncbi:protein DETOXIFICATION 34-like [Cryptomeria japonica]|uniref:protein DETOXIFICATION 34-like n=1 Tax=Cryptomeria japonica TaxID=3369 RepID=UPI0027D9FB2C|nr:protein DETOXIFICATION 34-like [Cryptomeria japonica]